MDFWLFVDDFELNFNNCFISLYSVFNVLFELYAALLNKRGGGLAALQRFRYRSVVTS